MEVTAALITRETAWPADTRLDPDQFTATLIATESPNVLRRFELAAQATTPHVYVQDDDVCINAPMLAYHYDGESLTHVMSFQMRRFYIHTGVTLLGYGAYFPTPWAKAFMDRVPYWERIFGSELVALECDRLFTWDVWPAHRSIDMPHCQLERSASMHDRPGHYDTRRMIFETLRKLPHPSGRIVR